MRLKNQYCFASLFITCLIGQTGCLILYRASSSFHIAINSMISLWVHSLLPLLFFFDFRLLEEEHKDVEGFTTDAILLTVTLVLCSVQYYWSCLQCVFVKFHFFLLQTHVYLFSSKRK